MLLTKYGILPYIVFLSRIWFNTFSFGFWLDNEYGLNCHLMYCNQSADNELGLGRRFLLYWPLWYRLWSHVFFCRFHLKPLLARRLLLHHRLVTRTILLHFHTYFFGNTFVKFQIFFWLKLLLKDDDKQLKLKVRHCHKNIWVLARQYVKKNCIFGATV